MIIFPLLLLLFACVAFAGWCFGVIRAAITFVGLLISLVLTKIFAHSLAPLFGHIGVTNPFFVWLLAPLPIFIISLMVFKIAGFVVQRKVNWFYKYKAGDLRMGLWDRVNPRLGACVGLANALIYMILISMVIYVLSYPTVQLAAGNNDHWSVRLLNEAGHELQSTGLARVAAAVNPMPKSYFEAADLAGLIYHNALLEARLERYPAFISLGETPEFQAIGASKEFTELRQRQPPFMEILNHPLMQPIMTSPDKLNHIWDLVMDNIDDLQSFLQTGLSDKYADKHLVGRWTINFPEAYSAVLETHTNYTSREMSRAKLELAMMLTNSTRVVAGLDPNDVYLKNLGNLIYVTNTAATPAPQPGARRGANNYKLPLITDQVMGLGRGRGGGGRGGGGPRGGGQPPAQAPARIVAPAPAPAPPPPQVRLVLEKFETLQGTWSGNDDQFQLQLGNRRMLPAVTEGDKLTIAYRLPLTGEVFPLVFDRDY